MQKIDHLNRTLLQISLWDSPLMRKKNQPNKKNNQPNTVCCKDFSACPPEHF